MPTGIYKRPSLKERFWSQVHKTNTCWIWLGHINKRDGYGRIRAGTNSRNAHAVALELRLGRLLKKGKMACHNCPEKRKNCVRHVYEGTSKQNQKDRLKDGTDQRGEKSVNAKLTVKQVLEIKNLKPHKYIGLKKELAEKFGVSPSAIGMVWSECSWKHLKADGLIDHA